MTKRLTILLSALLTVFTAGANDTLNIQTRLLRSAQERGGLVSSMAHNPSLLPLLRNVPSGNACAGYFHRHGNEMVLDFDPDNGITLWQADAKAFIQSGESSVWGNAGYDSGKHIDRQLCLSSDYDEVYPYVNTTLNSGDMRQEHYRFGGGWSTSISEKWRLGATLGYVAGHAYRQEDPRPRNITGELTAHFGVSRIVNNNYHLGADISIRRYSQSNSVMFVSEMGQESIYHLTGLGTFYRRFTGLGNKMSYTGYEPGIGFHLMPTGNSGFFAAAEYARLHTRCVLTALNKLPMAFIDQNLLDLYAGWTKAHDNSEYAIRIRYKARRRNGTENIFGDAVSGVYPSIGREKMYSYSRDIMDLAVSYGIKNETWFLRISPSGSFIHRNEEYDHKARLLKADRFRATLEINGASKLSHGFFSELKISGSFLFRSSSELKLPVSPQSNASLPMAEALMAQQRTFFNAVSSSAQTLTMEWHLSKSIGRQYAVGLAISWAYLHSAIESPTNTLNTKIEFFF